MEVGIAQQRSDVERLERARQEILEEVAHLRADLRSMAEPSADEADADAYEREKTWALVQSLQRKVESLDQAIRLAQSGVYGMCQSCGERIDPARLEILPEATLCLPCKREFERQNRRLR